MDQNLPLVLLFGVIVIATTVIRQVCLRLGAQPLVGFVMVGLAVGLAGQVMGLLTPGLREQLDLLGQIGVVILLFKVGLNSDITGLARQLRRAMAIWFSDVAVSAAVGFMTAFYLLGYGLLASLFVAVAMSATSIGISTAAWEQARRLGSDDGSLLVDVAELDDISAILLMVLLFTAAPILANGDTIDLGVILTRELAWILAKLALFAVSVYLFARHAERAFTRASQARGTLTVAVTGIACVIAGLAALIGFSPAIGALFAGLAFSRDPEEFQIDQQLEPVYQLLSPFFFVVVGLSFELASASTALATALVLLVAAVVGKLVGAGLPAMLMLGVRRGWLLGISMVPRAEIAMIVMLQGTRLGADYVPAELLGAMSLIVVTTSLLVPLGLGRLLPVANNGGRMRPRTDNIDS